MPIMQTVIQGGGTTPTGTLQITANDTYDVTDYASAEVQVPTTAPAHYIEYTNDNGLLKKGSLTPINLQGVSSLPAKAFYYIFCDSPLQTVGFTNSSSLINVTANESFDHAFAGCRTLTTLGLTNLKNISGSYCMNGMCDGCTSLTATGFDSVETINGYTCCNSIFKGCTSLTSVGLTNLTTVNGQGALQEAYKGCTAIQVANLPKLKAVTGDYALGTMFANCSHLTDVYFPNLQSKYTSGEEVFGTAGMLSGCSGVTVHFHPSQQSTIGTWTSVINGLGGTNTTVLFDSGVSVTASIPTGYTVYINNINVTNGDTVLLFEGDNDVVSVSSDGKIGKYVFVATSGMTTFTLDTTQFTYNEFTVTSNEPTATYSAKVNYDKITVVVQPDANNKLYVSSGFTITVSGSATGYVAEPVTQSSDTSGTITLTFAAGTSVTYDSSNILSAITGDTTYASVDVGSDLFLYHYPTSANWEGSVQLQLTVPAGTTSIKILTNAYVSSEANYDFGFISLGTQRSVPNYSQIKSGTGLADGVYLFRQSGLTNVMTPVTYTTNDTTQNMLNLGWGQDSSLRGTNTLYVAPITVIYYQ